MKALECRTLAAVGLKYSFEKDMVIYPAQCMQWLDRRPLPIGYADIYACATIANGCLRMRNYSPRPVLPVDRPTVPDQTEKRQTIAVTLRLRFAARVNYKFAMDQVNMLDSRLCGTMSNLKYQLLVPVHILPISPPFEHCVLRERPRVRI